jgi:hypothetical protein
MFFVMVASAFGSAASKLSTNTTSKPESSAVWAMPLPINPAPITPILRIIIVPFQAPAGW